MHLMIIVTLFLKNSQTLEVGMCLSHPAFDRSVQHKVSSYWTALLAFRLLKKGSVKFPVIEVAA